MSAPRRKRRWLRRMLSARRRSLEITKSGGLFILLTLAVGFAAINSGSNLLHAIFGAQLALIIGSGIVSEGTVRRVIARRLPGPTLHAQTPGPIEVQLSNTDPRVDLLSVSVEDDDRIDSESGCAPVFAVRVPAGGVLKRPGTVTMATRGRHRMPAAVVATRFPFGLFVKRRELDDPAEVVVLPRIHPVAVHPTMSPTPGVGEASGRAARVGEFYGLREYRDGDDPRRLYWPAVARLGRPVVREHEAHGDTVVMLELRAGKTGDPAFESDIEHVASLAVAHLRDPGAAVGLRYAGAVSIPPGAGDQHRRRVLEFLATVGGNA